MWHSRRLSSCPLDGTNQIEKEIWISLIKPSKRVKPNLILQVSEELSIEDFKNISVSKNGVNIGNIMENIALAYFGLNEEDEMHEIKSLILNRANILKNENTKIVYFVIISKYKNGLYKLENAQSILNVSVGIKELRALKLEKICELGALIK